MKSESKLYWTSLSADTKAESKSLYAVNEFELPQALSMSLSKWIELIVESQSAELNNVYGSDVVARLTSFIDRTRKVLDSHK